MNTILVIEDDEDINHLLCKILNKGGYETISAYSGTEAGMRLEAGMPDLILLDLMLPGMKGEQLTKYVRGELKSQIPIIILSAKTALENKVELLTLGADDYITKPFEPEEVLVRVMAALRRYQSQSGERTAPHSFLYKNLELNPEAMRVTISGKEIPLTPHEYELLRLLLEQPDKVFSRESLYERVWENGYYGEDNTVNVHMSNIRKKLAAADPENEYIKTVWGIGFKMV